MEERKKRKEGREITKENPKQKRETRIKEGEKYNKTKTKQKKRTNKKQKDEQKLPTAGTTLATYQKKENYRKL